MVPSRSESLPYVVLEAAAAGIPIIATAVGGIPEIFGPEADRLVPAADAQALATAIADALDDSEATREAAGASCTSGCGDISLSTRMVEGVLDGYRDALTARFLARPITVR